MCTWNRPTHHNTKENLLIPQTPPPWGNPRSCLVHLLLCLSLCSDKGFTLLFLNKISFSNFIQSFRHLTLPYELPMCTMWTHLLDSCRLLHSVGALDLLSQPLLIQSVDSFPHCKQYCTNHSCFYFYVMDSPKWKFLLLDQQVYAVFT